MVYLKSKKDPQRILILALTREDDEFSKMCYDESILFGAYRYVDVSGLAPGHKDYEQYSKLISTYPSLKSIVFLNVVKDNSEPEKDGF